MSDGSQGEARSEAVGVAEPMMVSVIVPHYEDPRGLEICLAKLAGQAPPALAYEIVVADNGSSCREALGELAAGRAEVTDVAEKGAGPARNGGVAHARGDVLAFIDSDCQAAPGWLAAGLKALERFDVVGGRVDVLVDDEAKMTPVEAFERVFAFNFADYIKSKGFAGAGNLFCRREVFERVGGFRKAVSEDIDWCHRATALGYTLGYAPDAAVGHPARRTWDELERKWRRINIEMYLLAAGKPGGKLRWLLRSLLLPVSAVIHTPRVLFTPKLNSLSQRLGALGILYRSRLWRLGHALSLFATADTPADPVWHAA